MTTETIMAASELPIAWMEEVEPFFLGQPLMRVWLEHNPDFALRVVVNRNPDGTIRSVLPFVVRQERIARSDLAVWRFVGWDRVWQPISFVPSTHEALDDFVSFVARATDEFDAIYFSCPTPLLSRAQSALSQHRIRLADIVETDCAYVPIDGNWELYWRGRSRKLRKNVGWALNKSARLGISLRETTETSGNSLLATFLELHRERWQGRGGSKYQEFGQQRYLADLTSALEASGMLYVAYLTKNDEAIAVAICARVGRKIHYLYPTFDPEYANISPGRLLLYHILNYAFSSEIDEVDLGPMVQYKREWTDASRSLVRAMLHRSNPRVWARYEAYTAVRRALARTGLKDLRRRVVERRRRNAPPGAKEPSARAGYAP